MEQSSPAIEVTDLHCRYRRARRFRDTFLKATRVEWVDALRGLSFDVSAGEVLGILGSNGAGKTSLIKILCNLVLPSGGAARVFGFDVAREAPAVLSRIGLVLADERSFYWRLTVRQNLTFFATLNDLERGKRASRIDELLEAVEIREWESRAFRDLSAGIRQRVALVRAMLTDPPLLLMDEPTNSLDPHAARKFRSWIRDELALKRGKTILLVTHDASEAEELCGRIGILREGRMEFLGTPAELGALGGLTSAHRLLVSGWSDALIPDLAGQGLVVRSAGPGTDGLREITVDSDDLELAGVFALLSRHGVRIHGCDREATSFPGLVAEMLGPRGGTR